MPTSSASASEGVIITRIRYDQARAEFDRDVQDMLLNVDDFQGAIRIGDTPWCGAGTTGMPTSTGQRRTPLRPGPLAAGPAARRRGRPSAAG